MFELLCFMFSALLYSSIGNSCFASSSGGLGFGPGSRGDRRHFISPVGRFYEHVSFFTSASDSDHQTRNPYISRALGFMSEAKPSRALKLLEILRYKARASAHCATPKMTMRTKSLIVALKCAIFTGIFCGAEVQGVHTLMPVQWFQPCCRFR